MEEVAESWTTFDSRVSLACDVGQPPRARYDSKKTRADLGIVERLSLHD